MSDAGRYAPGCAGSTIQPPGNRACSTKANISVCDSQLLFAQHDANLASVWGRSHVTGHPGVTFFNRGGGALSFDQLNWIDRQMNAQLFVFGPTGSRKLATLNNLIVQVTAI